MIRATPFHGRAAAANPANAWKARRGFTLAADYGDAQAEALALRLTCAMADISWRWRATIEGARAEEFLARLVTRNPAALAPGQAFKALWLGDGGGLRGAGVVARLGRETFQIVSAASGVDWIAKGAALFDVKLREESDAMLAVAGPYADKVMAAAGLDAALETLNVKKIFWRGCDVTLSRFGEHGGYEIACRDEDAYLLWDRIAKAGKPYALARAGLDAMDVADLEAGVPRPDRDYDPAAEPSPNELGLESLIDADHKIFNGRAAYLAAPRTKTRAGVELDGERPAPHAPLRQGGRTLHSLYSPALRRAIALAVVDTALAVPGTALTLMDGTAARVCALPFLS